MVLERLGAKVGCKEASTFPFEFIRIGLFEYFLTDLTSRKNIRIYLFEYLFMDGPGTSWNRFFLKRVSAGLRLL